MKTIAGRLFLFLLLSVLVFPDASSGQSHLWDQTIGGPDRDGGYAVTVDDVGNVYLSGAFSGTVDFGGGERTSVGGEDIFIVRFNYLGKYIWDRTYGDIEDDDIAYSLDTDSNGNLLVCGSFKGIIDFGGGSRSAAGGTGIFVLKLDSNGDWIWDETFGNGDNQAALSLAVDSENNVVTTGRFHLPLNFGGGLRAPAGSGDIFVVKLNDDGEYLWDRTFGGISRDAGRRITVDKDDNIYVVGNFENSIDFGGGERTEGDNEFYDSYLLKLGAYGEYVADRTWGGPGEDANWGVAVRAGDVYVTGYFAETVDFGGGERTASGSSDICIVRFDHHLDYHWDKTCGGGGEDFGYDIAFVTDEYLYMTGSFEGAVDFGGGERTSAGDKDIFLLEIDSQGGHMWDRVVGGVDLDRTQGFFVDPEHGMLVTGYFGSTVDFGGGGRTSNGSTDIFLVKYEAPFPATVSISPNTLNMESNGRWVTCCIELIEGFDIRDINIWSIKLNGVIPIAVRPGDYRPKLRVDNHGEWDSSQYRWDIEDFDWDEIPDLLVKFDRRRVISVLEPGCEVPIVITGHVGGARFIGTDYIRVIESPDDVEKVKDDDPAPEDGSLIAYPNPFNPTVRFSYTVARSSRVRLQIFDARGALVRTIEDVQRAPGNYSADWNGKNGSGAAVASGVYFCRFSIGGEVTLRKLMLLR